MALPDNDHIPTQVSQLLTIRDIPIYVILYFFHPVICVTFWCGCSTTVFVMMPETAMNKNHRLMLSEYDVWFSWQNASKILFF